MGAGGCKTRHGGEWSKKDARRTPGALILPRLPKIAPVDLCISIMMFIHIFHPHQHKDLF